MYLSRIDKPYMLGVSKFIFDAKDDARDVFLPMQRLHESKEIGKS
jgi:hypothetical protein